MRTLALFDEKKLIVPDGHSIDAGSGNGLF